MQRWSHVRAIYQIYPRSYFDTTGSGVGDINGVIDKLDYINGQPDSLGANAIWLSPFFPSPMADFGYDVSDFRAVDPLFGTLEDFKRLIAAAHQRSIKVMIDFVPNHTSDQHAWFSQSRSSRDNPKSDWYVWRDAGPDGAAPNNWMSVFGGSAWKFDDTRQQYYLHSFLTEQPDLNWENPAVRQEMADTIDFWLAMGVDGIRADAVRWIAKDPELRDNPLNDDYIPGPTSDPYHAQLQTYSRFGPQLFSYLQQLAAVVKTYDDRIIVFEDYPDDSRSRIEQYDSFYHNIDASVGAPFIFDGMFLPYDATMFRDFIAHYQTELGQYHRLFYCFGNHDQSRLATRFGLAQSRLVATLQLTLPGTPVLYYGEEIGMTDVPIAPDQVQDPFEKQTPGRGLGRDPQRSPMQWSSDCNAGFSSASPWLPIGADYKRVNVATEQSTGASQLSLYQALLKLRATHSVIRSGQGYRTLSFSDPALIAYEYRTAHECIRVLANMSEHAIDVDCVEPAQVLVSTHIDVVHRDGSLQLQPHQAVVIVER